MRLEDCLPRLAVVSELVVDRGVSTLDENGHVREINFMLFKNDEAMQQPIGSSNEASRPAVPLRRD